MPQKSAPIMIRMFKHDKMVMTDTSVIPMSSYLPNPIIIALHKALKSSEGMRSSDYIIGPVYENGKDFQFGVTGGVHHNEPYDLAIARELGEEIGLVPAHLKDLYPLTKRKYNGRETSVYECHIGNMMKVLDHQHGAVISQGEDNRDRKVGGLIYGTKKEIVKYMTNPIYVYDSDDRIDGVAAIKISDALKLIAANK